MPDRYLAFRRDDWATLRAATPLTLTEDDLDHLRGINERIDLDEVATVYLPLSRLLNLYVSAVQDLHRVSAPDHPRVDLVTTDGFLLPNRVLEERGLMERKGFPESYDTRALLAFLRQVKSGVESVNAPVYDHTVYDIVPDEVVTVSSPDIVIVEGLNVLQVDRAGAEFVSDYFDFSIYIDADEADIASWYVDRFLTFRASVFQRSDSFFRNFADLDDDEAVALARGIWDRINGRNLRENIEPTRERASLVVRKGADHRVTEVLLRKL